jgi:hypothetical protein
MLGLDVYKAHCTQKLKVHAREFYTNSSGWQARLVNCWDAISAENVCHG